MVPCVPVKKLDHFLARRERLGATDFKGDDGAGSAGFTASTGGSGATTGSGAGVGAFPLMRSPNLDIFNS